jgi:hypothetical protein
MSGNTFRQWVESVSPPALLGDLSAAFVGVTEALVGDQTADGLRQALRMPWLLDSESPDDVLPLIGRERRMPAYPAETLVQYRLRLWNAWDAYRLAGSETSILGQLAAAGYPNCEIIYYPGRPGPNGAAGPTGGTYWSQFWIRFASGSHDVVPVGQDWDSFDWDDGTVWGPAQVPPLFIATIRGIVRKWKPVDWICRGFLFEFGTTTWDSFDWDDGTQWAHEIEIDF